jgi:hypothetical protein
MSFDTDDLRISGGLPGPAAPPTSESDIRINYSNNCKVIAAANNATLGPQRMFYSGDGVSWGQTNLQPDQGDLYHRHPSVDWTSDETAWAITVATSNLANPFGLDSRILRCYNSTDKGVTWQRDITFSVDQNNVNKPRMWVDHSSDSPFQDNIYVIWSNDNKVYVKYRKRLPQPGAWQTPIPISGDETTTPGGGCDIKTNTFSGEVFAFWHDTDSRKLFVRRSKNGGAFFDPAVAIATTFGSSDIRIPSSTSHSISISGGAYQTVQKVHCDNDGNIIDIFGDSLEKRKFV